MNDLCLRASRRNKTIAVLGFGNGCCCLGTQSSNSYGRQLYRNMLMTDFVRNISDAVE